MPNKLYVREETAVKFRPSGAGGAGKNLNITSLADGAGRYSERVDLGSAARAGVYSWRGKVKLNLSGVIGQAIQLYLCTSDGTIYDGGLSNTAGAAISDADFLRNLQYLGSIIVDDDTSNITITSSGLVNIYSRYISLVVWNGTGSALSAVDADHEFYLTPVPPELQ